MWQCKIPVSISTIKLHSTYCYVVWLEKIILTYTTYEVFTLHTTLRSIQPNLTSVLRSSSHNIFANYFDSDLSEQQLPAAALSMRIDQNGCMVVWYGMLHILDQ